MKLKSAKIFHTLKLCLVLICKYRQKKKTKEKILIRQRKSQALPWAPNQASPPPPPPVGVFGSSTHPALNIRSKFRFTGNTVEKLFKKPLQHYFFCGRLRYRVMTLQLPTTRMRIHTHTQIEREVASWCLSLY